MKSWKESGTLSVKVRKPHNDDDEERVVVQEGDPGTVRDGQGLVRPGRVQQS